MLIFPLKVAILDDDKMSRNMVLNCLKGAGDWELEAFSDPEDALKRVKENKVNILITDIKMPNMPGDILLQKVAELQMGVDVIVITGTDSLTKVMSCYMMGAREVLPKPIKKENLINSVQRGLDHFKRWNDYLTYLKSKNKAREEAS